jgi:hypothetical protein
VQEMRLRVRDFLRLVFGFLSGRGEFELEGMTRESSVSFRLPNEAHALYVLSRKLQISNKPL